MAAPKVTCYATVWFRPRPRWAKRYERWSFKRDINAMSYGWPTWISRFYLPMQWTWRTLFGSVGCPSGCDKVSSRRRQYGFTIWQTLPAWLNRWDNALSRGVYHVSRWIRWTALGLRWLCILQPKEFPLISNVEVRWLHVKWRHSRWQTVPKTAKFS